MRLKLVIIFMSFLFVQEVAASSAAIIWKKKGKKEEKVEVKKETPYEKFFKGKKCETVKGLIILHKMDNKIYFELPLSLLGKDMLIGSTVTEITNNGFANVGEKPHEPMHVMFTRTDSTINLRQVTCAYMSKDRNLQERIKTSMMPAIIENLAIKAYSPDSTAVVIDMTNFLLSDNEQLNPFSAYAPVTWSGAWIEKEFKRNNSQIAKIKAFDDNVSVQSSLTYSVSLRDKRSYYWYKEPFTAVMTRTFLLLPEEPMRPRLADPRINIFWQGYSEFSNEGNGMKPLYYANRWRLEPKDEAAYRRGELVEPKKPIVFYIDNAFPEMWKPYMKYAVEVWQKAFENIGFKNAIIAKDFPTNDPEFDPDNLKYSCIRYSPSSVANAMGPSWTDPRTGEIINASVYVYHNVIKLVQDWRFLHTAAVDSDVRKVVLDDEIIGDCIRYVVSHEVGHCLALMHNMSASAAIPVDSLRSPSFTQKYGTTYSIMDYARNNYVAQPGDKEKGVRLTPPELGLYDMFSISWLYRPLLDAKTPEDEVPTLSKWISEKSGNLAYRYGKQQFRTRLDPSSVEEDLGDDAMKAGVYGIKNLKIILANLNGWVGKDDPDYRFRLNMYNEVIYQYFRYLNNVLMNIGGIYMNERYDGDVLPSYTVVPRKDQRRAVKFLLDQMKDMDWLDAKEMQEGYPLRGNIASYLQDEIFFAMIKQIGNVMICASKSLGEDVYTAEDYMKDIYDYVWAPTQQGKTLTSIEKLMQINLLTTIMDQAGVVSEQKGTPFALAGNMIRIPEVMKEQSRAAYGLISEEFAGIYSNLERLVPFESEDLLRQAERMGFDSYVGVTAPYIPTGHIYFDVLKKTLSLLKSKVNTGSTDTKQHYKLLIYKIEKALK
ncbi:MULTISPECIES: zinc-dependent metalloprotease [Butyricimonas]|uniref:zinc-dependent metalloprotease n=1 Tax=Butyricimonas TaxID=574697 RepID=UPI001B13F0E7|nr:MULTISPECIES: zinc-dependent metalloprotease [Butyricimonas]MBO4958846.1 zinc-dependent metalloprotease [Butyricimonas sp.]MCI7292449.1 zinc-dependent metalloprotease [Butyricimonas virosa]MDY6220243.1 zinc-dependent metalloprotease [Butyricimonas virosa]